MVEPSQDSSTSPSARTQSNPAKSSFLPRWLCQTTLKKDKARSPCQNPSLCEFLSSHFASPLALSLSFTSASCYDDESATWRWMEMELLLLLLLAGMMASCCFLQDGSLSLSLSANQVSKLSRTRWMVASRKMELSLRTRSTNFSLLCFCLSLSLVGNFSPPMGFLGLGKQDRSGN